jgi:hypothetical protein
LYPLRSDDKRRKRIYSAGYQRHIFIKQIFRNVIYNKKTEYAGYSGKKRGSDRVKAREVIKERSEIIIKRAYIHAAILFGYHAEKRIFVDGQYPDGRPRSINLVPSERCPFFQIIEPEKQMANKYEKQKNKMFIFH